MNKNDVVCAPPVKEHCEYSIRNWALHFCQIQMWWSL